MSALRYSVLWRCGLIALIGMSIKQLYGFAPAPLLTAVLIGLAVDTIVSLWNFREPK